MIGFNGTYLGIASHGNMRITAASIGGQWVMGGKWLTHATQQAIIAAFGAEEGMAVILRTNDYLNAIAATDPTRAQQLSAFINEGDTIYWVSIIYYHSANFTTLLNDYEMVTSITPATAHQVIQVAESYTGNSLDFECLIKGNFQGTWFPVYVRPYKYGWWIGGSNGNAVFRGYSGTNFISVNSPASDKMVKVRVTYDGTTANMYYDDVLVGTSTNIRNEQNGSFNSCIFSDGSDSFATFDLQYIKWDNKHHLIACYRKSDNVIGMFDVVDGTFRVNTGTGSFNKGENMLPTDTIQLTD